MRQKISPSQALLKLIEYYQKDKIHSEKYLNTLYTLFLDGIVNPEWRTHFDNFIACHKEDVLMSFEVSFEPQFINDDPTKRYFETHLAFESIKSVSKMKLPIDRLEYFANELKNMLFHLDKDSYDDCEKVIKGVLQDKQKNNELFKEYANLFKQIEEGKLFTVEQGISNTDKEKIRLIIIACFLSVCCSKSALIHKLLPLDVYGKDAPCFGYFGNQRGKILKDKTNAGLSQHYGLIKGHMPLSIDDSAFSGSTFNFLKSSEQAKYDNNSKWIKYNFYQLVHPFSNSISGTMLSLIRTLCYFQNKNITPFTDSREIFYNFIKLASSVIVFFSGGHSLNEIIHVLKLPEIIDELQNKHSKPINLQNAFISSIFLKGNEEAFGKALQKSIEYNNKYLQRNTLNAEIIKGIKLKNVDYTKEKSSLRNSFHSKKRKLVEDERTTNFEENNKKINCKK